MSDEQEEVTEEGANERVRKTSILSLLLLLIAAGALAFYASCVILPERKKLEQSREMLRRTRGDLKEWEKDLDGMAVEGSHATER